MKTNKLIDIMLEYTSNHIKESEGFAEGANSKVQEYETGYQQAMYNVHTILTHHKIEINDVNKLRGEYNHE